MIDLQTYEPKHAAESDPYILAQRLHDQINNVTNGYMGNFQDLMTLHWMEGAVYKDDKTFCAALDHDDTWYVWMCIGSNGLTKLLGLLPYERKFISYGRVRNGRIIFRKYKFKEFIKKCQSH